MSASLPDEQTIESDARAARSALGPFGRTFSALHYPDFRLLWIGAFTSTCGTFMQALAQGWLVYTMTGSALLLGFDGFLATGPMLLFSLFGGVIADRFSRRKVMLISQWVQMILAFILALLIFTKSVKIWHILLMSFLTGTAQSFSGPAYASLLPLLVRREDVPNAVAMNSMQFNLARVIGPALGGIVFALWGGASCFFINGLSFLAVIVAYLVIKIPEVSGGPKRGVMDEMRDGFSFVIHHRTLMTLTFLSFAGTFFGVPLFTMLPVVAKQFMLGARGLSVLQSVYGVGSVIGAVFVAATGYAKRKGKIALLMQLGFAILLIAFGLSRNLAASMVFGFFAGACVVGVVSLYSSLVQLATGDAMRGRVMSIFMLAFRGGMPLGNLLAGFIAQRWSLSLALTLNGVMLAVIATIYLAKGMNLDEA
ncbi:MAG TPA: MFS transporter [Thermoanaerobaculia bacterium]|nr:MFS transporter [Thermoanaerobaculia bacterium]